MNKQQNLLAFLAFFCLIMAGGFSPVFSRQYRLPKYTETMHEIEKTNDQALLTEIAKNNEDVGMRAWAVDRLNDQALLSEIVKNDASEQVRQSAVFKLNDQTLLLEIVQNDEDEYVRGAAERRLEEIKKAEGPSMDELRFEVAKFELMNELKTEPVYYSTRDIRIELARRGDKAERDRIFQAMKGTNLLERHYAIQDAVQIGDKGAIYHLAELLNDPSIKWIPIREGVEGGMTHVRTYKENRPQLTAVLELANMIENPPVSLDGKKWSDNYTDEEIAIWQAWWQENKAVYKEFANTPTEALLSPLNFDEQTLLEEIVKNPISGLTRIKVENRLKALRDEAEKAPPTQPEKPSTNKPLLWLAVIALLVIIGGVFVWKKK